MSRRSRSQVGPRDPDEAIETIRLRGADTLTQPGETVVAATLIVVGSSLVSELLREPGVDEALQRPVPARRTTTRRPA